MSPIDRTEDAQGNSLLRESIYSHLRGKILACELAPGTEIGAAEVAARFKVSKSPVRDALMRLERENLVVTLPRQGYRVAPISQSDVQDMFHLRAAMERACVERIVTRCTDAELATLDDYRVFSKEVWPGGFVAYNQAFHQKLAELGSNARMRDLMDDLMGQMERAVLVSLSSVKRGDAKPLVAEHCAIIDALQARRVGQAQRLVERHVKAAARRVNVAMSRMVIVG
ncbi:MAG: GntR family transcriptional regulator [Candidimonas sp.]|nr:MAG: GntR family transcriptional regulator [Candidimonas sp.]